VFIQAASEKIANLLTSQEQSIITLVKSAKSVHVFQKGETIPAGCTLSTVNDEINVLLMVKVKNFFCTLYKYIKYTILIRMFIV
jgi:valyl-tRNA synthetase